MVLEDRSLHSLEDRFATLHLKIAPMVLEDRFATLHLKIAP